MVEQLDSNRHEGEVTPVSKKENFPALFSSIEGYKVNYANTIVLAQNPAHQVNTVILFKSRREAAAIFNDVGLAPVMRDTQVLVATSGKVGLEAAGDSIIVRAVTEDAKLQEKVLAAETPGFLKDATQLIRERQERREAEKKAATTLEEGIVTTPFVTKSKVEDTHAPLEFTPDDQKYTIVKTQSVAERNNAVITADREAVNEPSFTSSEPVPSPTFPLVAEDVTPRPQSTSTVETRTPSTALASIENDVTNSQETVEKTEKKLWTRANEVKNRLGKMGLNGLASGLEKFSKLPPKNKMLFGVALAGASVATGGALMALPLLLSSTSFASHIYTRSIKRIEERDRLSGISVPEQESKRRKAALRAAIFGVVLAGVTAGAAHLTFPYVAEKVSGMVGGIRDFFTSSAPVPPPAEAVVTPTPATPPTGGIHEPREEFIESSIRPAPAPQAPTPTIVPPTPQAAVEVPVVDFVKIAEERAEEIVRATRKVAGM